MYEPDAADVNVLMAAVNILTAAMDDFVGACVDIGDAPKAPTRGALMKARSMLPGWCRHTLTVTQKKE